MAQSVATHAEYRAHLGRLTEGAGPAWLKSLRKAAFQHFEKTGYPTQKQEEWVYTDPTPFAQGSAVAGPDATVTRNDARAYGYGDASAHELVFVNGVYQPALSNLKSLPAGVRVQSLGTLLGSKTANDAETHLGQIATFDSSPFAALSTAAFTDGAFIDLADGVQLDQPIHLLFIGSARSAPATQFPRILVHLGRRATANLIESFVGPDGSKHVTIAVTEIVLDEAARLVRHKIQREPPTAHHLEIIEVEENRDAHLVDHNIAFGARTARTDIGVKFDDQGGETTLNGLFVTSGDQHIDNHTRVDHAKPNCTSREFYKGILDGKSRGVFYGKVLVRKDAQKTVSSQTNKNLLLSDGALVDSIPALEINADDVKCAHGSTIGQLDADSVFYLRSRGIDDKTARSLLTYGFARDVIGQIRILALRDTLDDLILSRLPSGRAVKEALRESV